MNNKILNTALVLIPKKLQSKAVAKALNFLFPANVLSFGRELTLQLEVSDLKRRWTLKVDCHGLQPESGHDDADIVVCAALDVILAAQDCRQLRAALYNGDIEIIADPQDRQVVEHLLQSVTQSRLDQLIERCYAFLKLKPKPRFDYKTVTLAEIRTARDVDWLRDEAVKLETSNMADALRLMEIAHQARPSGPFIKRKVEEYRSALAQQ